MNIKKAIRDAIRDNADRESRPLPRPHTVREKSAGELQREYHAPHYHLHFCFHNNLYIHPCHACKRSKREADANFVRFCQSV